MQQITVSLTLWPQMGGRMLRNMGCLHTAGRASWNLPALLPLHSRSARRFVGSAPTGCPFTFLLALNPAVLRQQVYSAVPLITAFYSRALRSLSSSLWPGSPAFTCSLFVQLVGWFMRGCEQRPGPPVLASTHRPSYLSRPHIRALIKQQLVCLAIGSCILQQVAFAR